MTSIGVFMATAGDRTPTLKRALHSITQQRLQPGDDVLIVLDGPQPHTVELVESLGPPFRWKEVEACPGAWGHVALNHALLNVKGDIIVGQDDDDIFAPRAFESIRMQAERNPEKFLLFKFRDGRVAQYLPSGFTWESIKDGHCAVIPNQKLKLGNFAPYHAGDQDFLERTHKNFGGEFFFCSEVVSIREPHNYLLPMVKLWDWEVRTPFHVEELRRLRNACRESMTGFQGAISTTQQQAWWDENKENMWAYLFTEGERDEPPYVAFSLLRWTDRGMTVSYGVSPEFRGKGYGYTPIVHSAFAAQGPMWGEVLKSNSQILKMDVKMGWLVVREFDRNGVTIIEVERKWPPAI